MGSGEFSIGDIVYLKTDSDQLKRIIVGIDLRPVGSLYVVACGVEISLHYSFELTVDADIIMQMGINIQKDS